MPKGGGSGGEFEQKKGRRGAYDEESLVFSWKLTSRPRELKASGKFKVSGHARGGGLG